eukprot:3050303-Alexandrium_andersonii.AAC.1
MQGGPPRSHTRTQDMRLGKDGRCVRSALVPRQGEAVDVNAGRVAMLVASKLATGRQDIQERATDLG